MGKIRVFTNIYTFWALILAFLSSPAALAHHEGTIAGPGIAGPIITLPARTLPKGKAFLGAGIKYTNFSTFNAAKERSLLSRGETTGQITESMLASIGGGYGITDDWDIYFSLPYSFKYGLVETDGGERTRFGNSIGLGDLNLLSQYRFFKSEKHGLYASLLGGLNVPIGEIGIQTDQGDKFGLDDQPGSGSWDPIFGAAVSKNLGPVSLDSNFLYRLSTQGPRQATVGDSVNYNIALSYRVDRHRNSGAHAHLHSHDDLSYHEHSHQAKHQHTHSHSYSKIGSLLAKIFPSRLLGQSLTWDLITELNYNWQERPEINDVEEENHGGHLLLSTQGIRAIINEKTVTNFGLSLPLIEGFNGDQPSPGVSLLFNISRLF